MFFLWIEIDNPCPPFNGSVAKLPLKLGHGRIITHFHKHLITYPWPIPNLPRTLSCLAASTSRVDISERQHCFESRTRAHNVSRSTHRCLKQILCCSSTMVDIMNEPVELVSTQTIFSETFSWMKGFVFWLKFHTSLFLWVQLTITQH